MNPKLKMIILLLFLPPLLGEVLSGSYPPALFFTGGIFFLVLLYGCGTLLIREAKARWNLQWSVIFLAVAYGIIEEGTMMQSFFNVGHVDLGVLSGYGMYLGVQWPWSIALTVYHATISTLIPLCIVEYMWPEYKDVPLLKKRGIILCFTGYISVIAFQLLVAVLLKEIPAYRDYDFSSFINVVTLLVVGILILLTYIYRESRITTKTRVLSPFFFGVLGFWIMAINLLLPNILAENQVSGMTTVVIQVIWVFLLILFGFYQVYNKKTTKKHITALIFGCLFFFILLTPLHEFGMAENPDPTGGMFLTGVVALVLLVIWRRNVLTRGEK